MTMVTWYLSSLVYLYFRLLAVGKSHARLISPPSKSSMRRLGFTTQTNFKDNGPYRGGFNVKLKAMPNYTRIVFFLIISLCGMRPVCCHARLMEPPSRSSMWRNGYETPTNYDDNGLYCGGFQVQWQRNSGKCGICGDPYDMPHPRDNEAGGKYGRGIISKTYISGQVIEAIVDVTTNHRGYFEFKICPNNNVKKEASQQCLDKHVLRMAGGGTKYHITDYKRSGDFAVMLRLPKGLTCSQCVFQWTYVAGNNWGVCDDGDSRLGCGPQETFRGCADIAILKHPGSFTPYPSQNDIEYKFQTKTSHQQKLFKETVVTNFPDYEAEISSQILTDKSTVTSQNKVAKNKSRKRKRPFSTWMPTELTADINQRTSLVYNTTNYKWNTSIRSTDSENKSEYYPPTTHSYFNKLTSEKDKWLVYNATNYKWNTSKRSTDTVDKSEYNAPTTHSYFNKMTAEKDKFSTSKRSTGNYNTNEPATYSYSTDNWTAAKGSTNADSKHDIYLPTTHSYPSGNPSLMVLESESKLNKMLEQLEGEIQLLRFYLQEDPGATTFADTTGTATYKDTVGQSTYKDTIGTSTYGTVGTSTYADTAGSSTYADAVVSSTYPDNAGSTTYTDTFGQSTVDGVNKIVKDYWYL